jgi:hypothetical protein
MKIMNMKLLTTTAAIAVFASGSALAADTPTKATIQNAITQAGQSYTWADEVSPDGTEIRYKFFELGTGEMKTPQEFIDHLKQAKETLAPNLIPTGTSGPNEQCHASSSSSGKKQFTAWTQNSPAISAGSAPGSLLPSSWTFFNGCEAVYAAGITMGVATKGQHKCTDAPQQNYGVVIGTGCNVIPK